MFLRFSFLFIILNILNCPVLAQENICGQQLQAFDKGIFGGNMVRIESVECMGDENSYKVTLLIQHKACPQEACEALESFTIEASSETEISKPTVKKVSGRFKLDSIIFNENNESFRGYTVSGIANVGNGFSGSFQLSYTVYGSLNDMRTMVTTNSYSFRADFTKRDFLKVMECQNTGCVKDTDADGIPDYMDDFPMDGSRTYDVNVHEKNGSRFNAVAYK